MAISELSTEEREKLSEKYIELNSIVKQREDLDTKMVPLCEKLDELETEEKELNKKYDEIILFNKEIFTSEYTSKLADITSRYVEISKEKEKIKQEMISMSDNFFNVRKEESILRDSIEAIVNKKEGSIFSENDEVVRLDKKGNVINKITVNSSNFSKISGIDQNIDRTKDTITKTQKNISSVIKENYRKTKDFIFNAGPNLAKNLSNVFKKLKEKGNELIEEFKKGYNEEEERVQNIINSYNKIRQEKAKVEEEASNLEFFSNNTLVSKNELSNDIDQNINYSKLEPIKENNSISIQKPTIEVLPTNSVEVQEAKTIDLMGVIDAVDNNSDKQVNNQIEPKLDTTTAEQIVEENDGKINLKLDGDPIVKNSSITIAKSDKSKKSNMITLFKTGMVSGLGKVAASISSSNILKSAKRDALRELEQRHAEDQKKILDEYRSELKKLEEAKQQQLVKSEQSFNTQEDAIYDIFSDRPSMVA